jgi:hypothetical protein
MLQLLTPKVMQHYVIHRVDVGYIVCGIVHSVVCGTFCLQLCQLSLKYCYSLC